MKVEGSNITINDSVYNRLTIVPKGACEQEGTPTPDNPIPVRVVTGDNSVVVQNKNLFDENNVTFIIGVLNDNGEPTGSTSSHYTENYYEVKSNSNYAISGTLNESENGYRIYFYDVNKNWISRSSQQNTNYIFTTPNNCKYIRIQVPINITLKTNDVQLEIGNVVTAHVAHQEQTYTLHLGTEYLAGIGDYKDEIVGKTDEWKIKRYVGKQQLPSDFNYRVVNRTNTTRFNAPYLFPKTLITKQDNIDIFSNYFIGKKIYDADEVGCYVHHASAEADTYSYFSVPNSIATTKEAFQTWLTTHEVFVYYQLQAPAEETITDTTLITDLNNMYQALSYDGTTNITVASEDTNAQMEVEVTYTSESDMCEKLLFIFNKMKDKLYHIIRSL